MAISTANTSSRFYIGSESVEMGHLSPAVRKELVNEIVKEVFEIAHQPISPNMKKFYLRGERLVIHESGQLSHEISLNQGQIKRIQRLFSNGISFARNTRNDGVPCDKRVWIPAEDAAKDVRLTGDHGAKLPFHRIIKPTSSGLALAKNILGLIPGIGSSSSPYTGVGTAAGAINLGSGVMEWRSGLREEIRAEQIDDREGLCHAQAKTMQGKMQTAGAVLFLTAKGTTLSKGAAAAAVGTVFTVLSMILSGFVAIVGSAVSGAGIARAHRFQKRINRYLENPHLNEQQRVAGALKHLREYLVLAPEEKVGADEKELRNRIETKVKYFERRSSLKALMEFLKNCDALIAKIENPATRKEGLVEGEKLLRFIRKESSIKAIFYALGLVASLLIGAMLIAGAFFGGGDLSFAFGVAASAIWMGLTIYSLTISALHKRDIYLEGQPTESHINAQIIHVSH